MRFVKNVMMDYLNGRNQKNKLDKNSIIGGEYENIIWHIENNREVSGDTIVLNDVLKALKNIEKRLK